MNSVTQLTQFFTPSSYKVQLDVDRPNRRFKGTVELQGSLKEAGEHIQLHAKDLTIVTATIDGAPVTTSTAENDVLLLNKTAAIQAGEHIIAITFNGNITDTLHGLYPGYYKKDGEPKELLVTQFESHHAREVFPCIDEPAAKAVFELTLTTEADVTAVSNTPIQSQKTEDGRLITVFEPTPKMSTYLLAFVVGELDYIEAKTNNGTVVRTYATEGQAKLTAFALEVAVKALEFYNELFDEPYPLPKCDLLAVPDFSAGAMENWGCITFRESALLLDPVLSDVTNKQWVAQVVVHELAHQWFGNLVTMHWWNDLWLNEGFARFMESYVAGKLFPEWQLDVDFVATNTAYAMRLDSLASTHPIQVEIHHPDEISTIFDGISYEKGAAAIRMLQDYLGDQHFRTGLQHYIAQHKYGNTVTNDLWDALSSSSGLDVRAFMGPWITKPGYPVVQLEQATNQLTLSQHRFYANPHERKNGTDTTWPIPILGSDPLLPNKFDTPSISVEGAPKEGFKLNKGQTGFYIVQYTTEQRKALAKRVADGTIPIADRLGMLNEAFELAKAGYLPTTETLAFLESYRSEEDQHVWSTIALITAGVRQLIDTDKHAVDVLNAYIRPLVAPQLKKLGWDKQPGEPESTTLLRQLIIGMACRADEPSAVKEALHRYDNSKDGTDIDADIRPAVYTTAARKRGAPVVTELLQRHDITEFDEERTNLAIGICSATQETDIAKILEYMAADKKVKSQNLGYWFVYLMRNPESRPMAWEWMKGKWQWISKLYEGDKSYDLFPRYSGQVFSTEAELQQYHEFFDEKGKTDPSLTRAVNQGIESIGLRIDWAKRDKDAIMAYLETSSTK